MGAGRFVLLRCLFYLNSMDILFSDTSNIYNYAKAYDERVSDEELEYVADVEQEWEQ